MNFKIGNGELITEIEKRLDFHCPECGTETTAAIFHNSDIHLIAKLPLISSNDVYFTICPQCKTTWLINSDEMKLFKNGEIDTIEPSSYTKAEKYIND